MPDPSGAAHPHMRILLACIGIILGLALSVAAVSDSAKAAGPPPTGDGYECFPRADGSYLCVDYDSGESFICSVDNGSGWTCRDLDGNRTPGARDFEDRLNNPGQARAGVPSPSPATQSTGGGCGGSWSVAVTRSSHRLLTLLVDYGDGTSESRIVSQGSGSEVLSFSHLFAGEPDGQSYVQRFTVRETGKFAATTTYHGTTTNLAPDRALGGT